MIDFSIAIDYRTGGAYTGSIVDARIRLGRWTTCGFVLKDRIARGMSRIAVEVTDERGNAEVELLLMGDTLYVLGARVVGEAKWTVCKQQGREFNAVTASVGGETEFQSGYGALGIAPGSDTPTFRLEDCSRHVASLKAYLKTEKAARTAGRIDDAKLAFAYFAMTVGESIRFRSICARLSLWGIDPCGSLPELQRWVVDSTVKDSVFPSRIAVYGIHEKTNSELFKQAMENLKTSPALAPGPVEYKAAANGTRDAMIDEVLAWIGGHAGKVGDVALAALRSGFFKNRINGTQFVSGLEFVSGATKKKNISVNNFAAIDQYL